VAGPRAIIVTGASRGIGHATALRFHGEGRRVFPVERDIPMRHLGTIEEVADLICFLCPPQATYITGAEIPINGGQHA
jgi:NAD(P)-dependent dehydrogenase (short-subunit alcohol dehydrogenase family)